MILKNDDVLLFFGVFVGATLDSEHVVFTMTPSSFGRWLINISGQDQWE